MPPDTRPGFLGRFRDWRRSRPFWGGLLTVASGLEIIYLPLSPVSDLIAAGVVGAQSVLVGFLIAVLGVFVWFSPTNRTLAGVLTIIFAVSSLVLSNLGGLVVGMLAGIVGGALTLAWTDQPRASTRRRPPTGPSPSGPGSSTARPSPRPRSAPDTSAASLLPTAGAFGLPPSTGARWRWRQVMAVGLLTGLGATWAAPAPAAGVWTVDSALLASGWPGDSALLAGGWPDSALTAGARPAGSAPTRAAGSAARGSVLPAAGEAAAQPSRECLAALATLPADLLEHLLPGLHQLLPGLDGLLSGLLSGGGSGPATGPLGLPLLGGVPSSTPPVQPQLTADELRRRQLAAAQACQLPQLLPGGSAPAGEPVLPSLPSLPLPDLGLPGGVIPGSLPELPLPSLPSLPELPRLPLPSLPLPQLPEVPFPELPGLPGLPGVDPPPGAADPPLPVAPDPDAEQRVFPAEDGEVAPTVTSTLTMTTLDATDFAYVGMVELPTATGGVVRALRFSIATMDAGQLRLGVPTPTGHRLDLGHAPGGQVSGTEVTIDCTSIALTALGVLPLTFTLDAPPPSLLTVPSLPASDVRIDLVTFTLGAMSVPGADAGLSGPGTGPDVATTP